MCMFKCTRRGPIPGRYSTSTRTSTDQTSKMWPSPPKIGYVPILLLFTLLVVVVLMFITMLIAIAITMLMWMATPISRKHKCRHGFKYRCRRKIDMVRILILNPFVILYLVILLEEISEEETETVVTKESSVVEKEISKKNVSIATNSSSDYSSSSESSSDDSESDWWADDNLVVTVHLRELKYLYFLFCALGFTTACSCYLL